MIRLSVVLAVLWSALVVRAETYDEPSLDNPLRMIYEGCVLDVGENFLGKVRVVAARPDKKARRHISATAELIGEGKVTFVAVRVTSFTNLVLTTRSGTHSLALDLGDRSFSGKLDGKQTVTGLMDFFTANDVESKRRRMAWQTWRPACVVAFESALGWSVFAVKAGANGRLATTGVMADGRRVTTSSRALIRRQGALVEIPIVMRPKGKDAEALGFLMTLTNDVLAVSGGTDFGTRLVADAECPEDGRWQFKAGAISVPVEALNGRWNSEKGTAVKLTLSHSSATGLFRGSYVEDGVRVTVNGALVEGVGLGTGVRKDGSTVAVRLEEVAE